MTCEIPSPIVFFSDLHLTSKSSDNWQCELERLKGLWENAKTVFLNGDTISWRTSMSLELHKKLRDDITDYFYSNALETVFVAGNSD